MRSMLFVPGDSERKLGKCLEAGADALILDLEDSVGADRKEIARDLVRNFLAANRNGDRRGALWVRINSFDSPHWRTDLEAVMAGAPVGLLLPKTTSGADVRRMSAMIDQIEADLGLNYASTQILPIVTELPVSILSMHSYIGASERMTALSWGAEDLSAELGAQSTRDETGCLTSPFRLARDLALMTAVASAAQPIDTVFVNFRDETGLNSECERAVRDGFTGKLAIHPAQIPVINAAFTPSDQQVAWAQEVITAFADASVGVASLGGEMVDRPHLRRAQTIMARAKAAAAHH